MLVNNRRWFPLTTFVNLKISAGGADLTEELNHLEKLFKFATFVYLIFFYARNVFSLANSQARQTKHSGSVHGFM